MSYVLDGVEAPTLDALELALSRRQQRSARRLPRMRWRGVAGPPSRRERDEVVAFVRQHKPLVRRYLIKYGATDRAGSKGTKIRFAGRVIDLSRAAVNRADTLKLAGMLAATIGHDAFHAVRMAASAVTGLGTLGEAETMDFSEQEASAASSSSENAVDFKAVIDVILAIGPQVVAFVQTLFAASEREEAAAAAAAATAARKTGRASTSSSSTSLTPRSDASSGPLVTAARPGVHPVVFVFGALAIAGAIYWLTGRKSE